MMVVMGDRLKWKKHEWWIELFLAAAAVVAVGGGAGGHVLMLPMVMTFAKMAVCVTDCLAGSHVKVC